MGATSRAGALGLFGTQDLPRVPGREVCRPEKHGPQLRKDGVTSHPEPDRPGQDD